MKPGALAELGITPTPVVRLDRICPKPAVSLFAKLEWHLPTGSLKDRPAAAMLADAENRGLLSPGIRLLEPTSGNTGIALARLARRRHIPLTVVVPANVSTERKQLLAAFGADIVESPGEQGSNGAVRKAESIAAGGGWLMLNQYANPANPDAHYLTTGPEILEQIGTVDVLVACLGTGGTLMGAGRALREANPAVKVIAVEPPTGELIAGLRSLDDGYAPPIFDPARIDGRILVRTGEAVAMARRLLEEEGLFAGLSSGAAVHACLRWVERVNDGTIVTILPDGGWKYLSTGAWSGTIDEAVARIAGSVYF